jgi:AcrR family transcriptional regulator
MSASPATPAHRRSQAQRSSATREALLDATIACLVEDGYASTTTSRVAERAGVSRGAHLHHFQTRPALVAAAIEHLARRRTDELPAAAGSRPAST